MDRLSQSRSLGFLVWCGRLSLARASRSYDRASRSQSRYALKSSTCEQVYPVDSAIQHLNKSFKEGICQQNELTTVALSFSGRGSTKSSSFSLTASLPQAFLNTDLNKKTNKENKKKQELNKTFY